MALRPFEDGIEDVVMKSAELPQLDVELSNFRQGQEETDGRLGGWQ